LRLPARVSQYKKISKTSIFIESKEEMNSNKLVPNGVINVGSNQPETKSEQKKNIVEKPTRSSR
jgi:hypothetical protein